MRYICACASLLVSAGAHAQVLDLRIVERTGQTSVDASDNVLDFAVQARISTLQLGGVAFDVHIVGEPESAGTLARMQTSNPDGTYFPGFAVNSQVGIGGLASSYSFVAALNASYNGSINTDGNTFTNGPDQEIGGIAGFIGGAALLHTPGMDADEDGNPDTWSGNGTGTTPPNGSTATIPTALRGPYFARQTLIDIYRFRYTVTNLSTRQFTLTLENAGGSSTSGLVYSSGLWGASNLVNLSQVNVQGWTVTVPAVPSLAVFGPLLVVGGRGRRPGHTGRRA